MSELTPELAADVAAACQEGAEEAAGALSRSLDGEFTVEVGQPTSYASGAPDGFDGAGLAVLMKFGDVGVAAILPESSGLLPSWYASPDPTGESKLSTLAQELSMLLVPETLMADVFEAARIVSIGEALSAAAVAEDAALVPLQLSSGDSSGQLSVIWPLASPDSLFPSEEAVAEGSSEAPPESETVEAPQKPRKYLDYSDLPGYSRSLLKIPIPVRVVLASKKEKIGEVVELAPGSIIKFDKSCEELLNLYVGNQEIAVGEAVKVGDKFGFRISSMQMPHEHFLKVRSGKTV